MKLTFFAMPKMQGFIAQKIVKIIKHVPQAFLARTVTDIKKSCSENVYLSLFSFPLKYARADKREFVTRQFDQRTFPAVEQKGC